MTKTAASDPATAPLDSATPRLPVERLSDVLYNDILERIVDGSLESGARLPTEAELASQHGVSRPVVRQALARLRDDGVISSRQGSGSFVLRRPPSDLLMFAPLGGVGDMQRCFEFRIGLEGEAAALAAERRTEADLTALEAAFQRIEAAIDAEELGADADMAFHLAICDAAQNRFYATTLRSLSSNVVTGIKVARNLSRLRPPSRMRLVQAEHRAILDAISDGDPDRARRAARRHLEQAKRRVFEDGTG